MNASTLVRVIAIGCTGLAAGVFLGHWRGVSIATPQLDPSSFIQLQQSIHVHFVPMMPILLFGAAGASIAWALILRTQKGAGFWLVAGTAVAMTTVLGLTLGINVPINRQLMTWNAQMPPADLMQLWRPWEVSHAIRTLLALAAFATQAFVVSLTAAARAPTKMKSA